MPNIRCKTCGRTYSYEKQGMCPKCGAYNRPPRRERVDPDGSVHYLDDRSAITGVVPNHPRDKVCFEEKVCYEIGNRHAPLFWGENDTFITIYNEPMLLMLQKLHGVTAEKELKKLDFDQRISASIHNHHH